LGLAVWLNDGLGTVGEVAEAFAQAALECDRRLGEPAGVRYFLNWFDETPRDQMRLELAAEIEREQARRVGVPVAA